MSHSGTTLKILNAEYLVDLRPPNFPVTLASGTGWPEIAITYAQHPVDLYTLAMAITTMMMVMMADYLSLI